MSRSIAVLSFLLFSLAEPLCAQTQLDTRPFDPEKDPDINMFFGNWEHSLPFNSHGTLMERALLTRGNGDPVRPSQQAGVLQYVSGFSRAILEAGVSTSPTVLQNEQEIFYITWGRGELTASDENHELREGVFFLVPAGVQFKIANLGDEPMTMYLIREPVLEGFQPSQKVILRDEKAMRYQPGYITSHWSNNSKILFKKDEGDPLCVIDMIMLTTYNAMVIGQPHSHPPGHEEVWTVIEGKNLAFMGREIRWQEAGTAYKVPPTGYTPHANINPTDEIVKMLYFAKIHYE